MALEIRTAQTSAGIRMNLIGELDSSTAPHFEQTLTQTLVPGATMLVLDLSALVFVSSAGLRLFALAQKKMKVEGGKACFLNPTEQVKRVFSFVKAVKIADVFDSEDDLDRHLEMLQNPLGS